MVMSTLCEDQLIQIFEDTVNKCEKGKFKKLDVKESIYYQFMKGFYFPKSCFEKMEIEVVNEDTLVVAEKYSGQNTCILNMASKFKPGGGVRTGKKAQEEELFRRTNYFKTLSKEFYEIAYPDIIYSPKVWIVKDKNYQDLEKPWSSAFIAAPMLRRPQLDIKGYYQPKDLEMAQKIIEHIFAVAFENDHEILILGALGCGAYRNPPEQVIPIFNEMLTKYYGCFKKVIFAVYSQSDTNFDMFNTEIKKIH